ALARKEASLREHRILRATAAQPDRQTKGPAERGKEPSLAAGDGALADTAECGSGNPVVAFPRTLSTKTARSNSSLSASGPTAASSGWRPGTTIVWLVFVPPLRLPGTISSVVRLVLSFVEFIDSAQPRTLTHLDSSPESLASSVDLRGAPA